MCGILVAVLNIWAMCIMFLLLPHKVVTHMHFLFIPPPCAFEPLIAFCLCRLLEVESRNKSLLIMSSFDRIAIDEVFPFILFTTSFYQFTTHSLLPLSLFLPSPAEKLKLYTLTLQLQLLLYYC